MPKTNLQKSLPRNQFIWPLLFLVAGLILGFLVDSDLSRDMGILFIGVGALWATILFIILQLKLLTNLPGKTTYTKKQTILLIIIFLFAQVWAFGFGMSFGNPSSIIADWLMGIGVVGMLGLFLLWKQKRFPFV